MEKFEQAAKSQGKGNVVTEFWLFLNQTKKWWLLPIVIILAAFAILMALSGTAAAPFIYTLF
jgi:drug/metabolite transporter superfamily protein YnfA